MKAKKRVEAVAKKRKFLEALEGGVTTEENGGHGKIAGEGEGGRERKSDVTDMARPGDDLVVIPTGTSSAVASRFRNGTYFFFCFIL